MHPLLAGAVSGALGTVALNTSTYLDMAVRGRPASSVPDETVGRIADALGVDLAEDGDDQVAANRRSAVGALMGYATGAGVGMAHALLGGSTRRHHPVLAGLAVGTAAMVVANGSAAVTGATDPREWGAEGWLADIVPHVLFGLVTVATFHQLRRG